MKPRYSTYEVSGLYGFRFVDLDIIASVEYGRDYMDVLELFVYSSRRECMVKSSDRLLRAFQDERWSDIEAACEDAARAAWEDYRDTLEVIGCMKATEMMERRAEREMERRCV